MIEIERLSKNLLNPLPLLTCPSVSDNYITIASLNVRSIVPEIPDINLNMIVPLNVEIFCFTETWLTSTQATPVLYDDHTVASCNCLSGDNDGGVILSVSLIM